MSVACLVGLLLFTGFGCGEVASDMMDADPDDTRRQFEVIYISDLSVSSTLFTAGNMGVVINRGTVPLDLGNVRIVTVADDHPQANFEMSVTKSNTVLTPNRAAGDLSPAARQLIVDSGMVTEERIDTQYSMSISLRNAPDGDYKVTGSAILEIDRIQVQVPIVFQHGTTISFNRVSRLFSDSQDE